MNLCWIPGPFSASVFVGFHCLIKMHILLTVSYIFLIVPVEGIFIFTLKALTAISIKFLLLMSMVLKLIPEVMKIKYMITQGEFS